MAGTLRPPHLSWSSPVFAARQNRLAVDAVPAGLAPRRAPQASALQQRLHPETCPNCIRSAGPVHLCPGLTGRQRPSLHTALGRLNPCRAPRSPPRMPERSRVRVARPVSASPLKGLPGCPASVRPVHRPPRSPHHPCSALEAAPLPAIPSRTRTHHRPSSPPRLRRVSSVSTSLEACLLANVKVENGATPANRRNPGFCAGGSSDRAPGKPPHSLSSSPMPLQRGDLRSLALVPYRTWR